MSSGFEPTHRVPKGGTRAWANPDASATPVASLHARTELQALAEEGAWSHVRAANGWEGWVDGRVLVAIKTRAADAAVESESWVPTHQVGSGGTSAWEAPDPSADPVAQLPPRVTVQVLEEQGAWAHVSAENGWRGWIDGRTLRAVGAGPASSPAGVLPLVGAAIVLLGSFLPLWSWGGAPITAWQIPILSLFYNSASAAWLLTGVVLLPILLVGLPLMTGRPLSGMALATLGAIGVDVAIITLLRTGAEDLSTPEPGLFVILLGGLAVIAAGVRRGVFRAKT